MKVAKTSSRSFTLLRSLTQGWQGDCCVESITPVNKGRRGKTTTFLYYLLHSNPFRLWGRARGHNSYMWWILHTNVAFKSHHFARKIINTCWWTNGRVYTEFMLVNMSHMHNHFVFLCALACLILGNREGPMRVCTRVIFLGYNKHFNAQ